MGRMVRSYKLSLPNLAYQRSLPNNHNIPEWAIVGPKGKTLPDKEIITEEIYIGNI